MRASPPIEVEANRGGPRPGFFVVAVVPLTGAAIPAWIAFGEATLPSAAGIGAAVVALGVAVLALGAAWPRPIRPRWSGSSRQLGDVARQREPAGTVQVAIEPGLRMPLRLAAGAAHGRLLTWLAVRRPGLEPRWHGLHRLHCAPFAPRPESGIP